MYLSTCFLFLVLYLVESVVICLNHLTFSLVTCNGSNFSQSFSVLAFSFWCFFNCSCHIRCKGYLTEVSICISPVKNIVEYISMCFLGKTYCFEFKFLQFLFGYCFVMFSSFTETFMFKFQPLSPFTPQHLHYFLFIS